MSAHLPDPGGDPGGVRDERKMAPDAPATTMEISPAGMELTFQADDPAAFVDSELPDMSQEGSSFREPHKKISFKTTEAMKEGKSEGYGPLPPAREREKPSQFREQFDHLMTRLEDRFQNERLSLEEKHSRELEEAMGYFSLSSGEREAKQQELQLSLLEDIGNMAQQLQELTGTLGADEGTGESLTLPSDPNILEEYARKMQRLEEHFQNEKIQLEQKHASEMEEALGTLKMSRQQRQAKKLELHDELSAELGGVEKQLEELNRAKEEYEAKMGNLKRQLSQDDRSSSVKPPRADPKLRTISRRLSDVERERDAAKDELRRLKLALQVTQGDAGTSRGQAGRSPRTRAAARPLPTAVHRPSAQEGEKIADLRGRIEDVERELKEAAQSPGGSNKMKRLRDKMKLIETDLAEAEDSTKEHFALEHLRARMEKVEKLLTEGERAARDWEALEELRNKIGNVDNDLKAVEEAKREFEALEALRAKMEAVESELKMAEQLATDRENVDNLRQRLGQVEMELGVAEPAADDHASIEKLLDRLARAETTLEDARQSTKASEIAFAMPSPGARGIDKAERDEEVEKILNRLSLAEKKLKAAKQSAQRRNPNVEVQYSSMSDRVRPQSATPFDERQSRIRARLQEHLDEASATRQAQEKPLPRDEDNPTWEPQTRRTIDAQYGPRHEDPTYRRLGRGDSRGPTSHFGPTGEFRSQQREDPRDYSSRYAVPPDPGPHRQEPRDFPSRYDAPSRDYGSHRQEHNDYRPRNFGEARPGQPRLHQPKERFDEPRPLGGFSRDGRYYVEDVHLDRTTEPRPNRHSVDALPQSRGNELNPSAPLDSSFGPATQNGTVRPLRRRRPGDAAGSNVTPPKSTNYSVLGDNEDRYKADLEELKYQRALLSQKLPKKKTAEEEEKKGVDRSSAEPEFSWKKEIRNQAKQQMREKVNPKASKALKTTNVEQKNKPEEHKEVPKEVKVGGDPPIQAAPDVSGDPPVQVPSLGDDLKFRILARQSKSNRDPNARDPSAPDPNTQNPNAKTVERGIIDPPDLADPPATARRRRRVPKKRSPPNPSDESGMYTPVRYPEPFYDADSISTAELPTNYEPEVLGPPKRVVYKKPGQSSARNVAAEQSNTPTKPSVTIAPPPPEQAPQPVPPMREAQATQSEILQPPAAVEQKPAYSLPPTTQSPPPPQPPPRSQTSPPPQYEQAPKPPPEQRPASSVSSGSYESESSDSRRKSSRAKRGKPPRPPPPIQIVQPPPAPPVAAQQPIFHQTTVVDGKAAARERREKDQLMRWVVLVLLCLAIVLAVVIIVVVVLLRNGTTTQSVPTPSPAPFTPSPTSGFLPTIFPTGIPGNGTNTTNATMFPTSFPTTEGSNSLELCPMLDSTTPLRPDGITQQLSTVGASFDPSQYGLMGCGVIGGLSVDGVWYAMIGDGDVVTISTCTQFYPSFDTQLVVFTPVNQTVGCREGLECVTSNDNFCGQQSSVTFIAQMDTLYFVYVSGMTAAPQYASPTEGDFSLTVSTSPEGSCQGAIGPLVPSPANQLPVIVVGDLLGGTFGVDPCNPTLQTRTGELWYIVTGTGRLVVASTCHALSNFQARLAVYTGASCDVLMCETANDMDCGNGSEINWFAEAGKDYYLLVYSPDFVPDGQFGITVQEIY